MLRILLVALVSLALLACSDDSAPDGDGDDGLPPSSDGERRPVPDDSDGLPPIPTRVPTPRPRSIDRCSPSYDVCIPPAPPDLDCGDIEFRRFTVRPPDPHGFDADFDGVGCESG